MTDERLLGGRYRLERLLGRGGMAEVHAAHDEVLDRQVAVKLLLPRFRDDEAFVARFRREAQASASLNHPNIVAVYDTGSHESLPFIVMELVRGRSLQEVIRSGGLTEDRALEVVAETCAALQYAHDRGLIHRDVKPGNILLADDGAVKVTDFGIARAIDAETVTETAAVLGTAAYLSPEQAQGMTVDARSDVYSLGVVLYEVLTGRQPFQGDTPVTVAYQHVQELARPPRDWNDSISTAAEAIAVRAMAKNPVNRYPSAADMRDDLLRARAGERVAAPAVLHADETALLDAAVPAAVRQQAVRTPQAERRKRILGYVLLGILSVAAFFGIAVLLAQAFAGGDTQLVTVPEVTGRTVAEAETLLEQRGLRGRVVDDVFSDQYAAGVVARQVPAAGGNIEPGGVVQLSQSRGREQVAVPTVVGRSESEAAAMLRSAGLVTGAREQRFDESEPGTVLETDPAAGEMVARGERVDLVVSAGEERVRVRPVVLKTEADARFDLEAQGFEVLVVREFSDGVEEGVVIRQDPEPATELEKGAEVTIVVSRGPEAPPSPSPSPSPSPTEVLPPPDPEPSPDPSPTA